MKKTFLIYILFGLLITTKIFSQIKIHKHITANDEIISPKVYEIFEDSKGFFWFATPNGVSKWDGKNFENFSKRDGLVSSYIYDIAEDSTGKLYFANFGKGGLNTYQNGKIDTMFFKGKNKLSFLSLVYITKDGSLLMASSEGIMLYKNNVLLNLNSMFNIELASIYEVIENSKGEIFFATDLGILKVYENKMEVVYGFDGTPNNFSIAIGINNYDEILFTNEKKILLLKDNDLKEVYPQLKYLANEILDIVFSKDNTCYLATKIGLVILKSDGSFEILTTKNGLTNNHLSKIYLSRNQDLYIISSTSDVNIYSPGRLENQNKLTGLISNNIFNIFIDKEGRRYFSTDEGLQQVNNKFSKIFPPSENSKFAHPILFTQAKSGSIYLGTFDGIDELFNSKYREVIKFSKSHNIKYHGTNHISALTSLNDSTLLAGSYKGVYKIVNNDFSVLNVSDGLSNNFVTDIIVTKDKRIVYGYHSKGISINQDSSFKHYTIENSLINNDVTHICERSDGALLVGTKLGLSIIEKGKITSLTTEQGLLADEIRAIAEDDFHNIYVTTSKGVNILRFNPELRIRSLTVKDGLASNNCSPKALFIDNENNVWIGTSNGVSKYNPKYDLEIKEPPKVHLTEIEIFNEAISIKEFIQDPQLQYNQNYISFSFIGLNIPNNHKVKYQYKLSRIDKEWINSKATKVQYTNLDDGKYTFEVKATNEWGYWSKPVKLSFVIAPAWWETWWFYTLVFISLASLIAFIASYRYRQLLEIEKIRTKISADLHDSIGSGLSEITILSELLHTQSEPKIYNLQKGLKNISITARSLVGNMSDIVWLVTPSKDSLRDLLLRLQDSYQEVFSQANISFSIKGIDELRHITLPLTYRQHLFLLFKEAINNSLKHSGCSEMILALRVQGKNLIIQLTDNGKGFDTESKSSGNGLRNIKERAKNIGGKVEIISELNVGTKIEFSGKVN